MKNHETFGAKDDFRLCRSFLTPGGMLCLEVPKTALDGGNNVAFSDVSQVDLLLIELNMFQDSIVASISLATTQIQWQVA